MNTVEKIKKKLSYYSDVFKDWVRTSGLCGFWIALIVMGVIVAIIALLGLVVGIAIGIPALILYLALNWVVPAFGGPVISYWTAAGLVILIPIVIRLVHGGK